MSVSGIDFFRTVILRKSLNKYYDLKIHNSDLNDQFSLLARELNKRNVIDTSYEFLKNTFASGKLNIGFFKYLARRIITSNLDNGLVINI